MTKSLTYSLILTCLVVFNSRASVPVSYSGKVSIDGINFDGQLKFKFTIYTASNDLVWDSGSNPIEVPVSNGRYLVLLGGQGMRPLPASLFHQNDDLYIGVHADLPNDKIGLVKLGDLQPITAQPYALVAEMAKTADSVKVGAIATAQLNERILKYLKPEITQNPDIMGVALEGSAITIRSQVEGKYLSYQWYKNGQPIPGAIRSKYVINDVNKSSDNGNYSFSVSNEIGSVTSDPIKVEVGKHVIDLNTTVDLEMIWCPPGTFAMGSPTTEAGRMMDETQHQVTLTNGFYLGKYEVTQAQYEAVMTGNSKGLNAKPSRRLNNDDRPVEQVSWYDVQVFLSRLNVMEEKAGRLPTGWKYVLPTEAQWEYACRAGTTTAYSWGATIASSNANYNWDGGVTSGVDFKQTRDVGQYAANPWGFFDMHGNVMEMVHDWHAYFLTGAQTNPEGPASGSHRVTRGSSWNHDGSTLRSANRRHRSPSTRAHDLGFRVGFQEVQPDTANPELTLAGNSVITHSQGIPFIDPGVEAHDVRDGNITDQIVVTGTVDINRTGTYILTYTVKDGAGNTATATRTVTVTGNRTVDLNATVAMEMIWCPPGTFTMGSPVTESGRSGNEAEHNVTLTQGFYLGKYEVTQAQYEAVMTGNTVSLSTDPSQFKGSNRPVENVSWEDAQIFLTRLNEQQAGNLPAGWSYVLPTEAQWEYACRAGTTTAYSWGDDINATRANYSVSGLSQTRNVGYYAANPWGFFDMHGNVEEWANNRYSHTASSGNPVVDPIGPVSGSNRVARSGSWYWNDTYLRSGKRFSWAPNLRSARLGFRVGFQAVKPDMASTHTVDLNATVAMEMIWCPPGTFTMGSPLDEFGRSSNEAEHNVSLTQGFYLGKYEVTQAQYEAVMTGNTDSLSPTPSQWPINPNRPVLNVSWNDALVFLARLNEQQAGNLPAGWSYVLPTESQWEYACRAGTTTIYSWGNSNTASTASLSNSNYFYVNTQTRDVGNHAANPWGFFDMHGNVWEWTADWYQAAYPSGNPVLDPTGPASGSLRVLRGGSWTTDGSYSRSAERVGFSPGSRYDDVGQTLGHGFRVGFQQQ
jgi:formylglycine-generating enzyme required for sulfatase activity